MKAVFGTAVAAGLTAVMLGILGAAAVDPSTTGPGRGQGGQLDDIPAALVGVYVAAADWCPGLPWTVLAAIGSVESGHGGDRLDPVSGQVHPPILGPALDGSSGFARIPDRASADGWAHAQGPMQFLPSTWRAWGRLAPGRPVGASPDPQNAFDAIWSAAAYLCGTEGRITDVRVSILRYNRSTAYVERVLSVAARYGGAAFSDLRPGASSGLTCPVLGPVRHSNDWHAPRSGGRVHQGNDLFAPLGTTLVAIEAGTIERTTEVESGLGGITLWLRGDSGIRWYYAHNLRNLVRRGDRVTVGQPIAVLGNTGNARTTPAHLHLEMHASSGAVNPYPTVSRLCQVP